MSRAGVALLRELADESGLTEGWTAALLDGYKAFPTVHMPGAVLRDLVVTIAEGGDALSHLAGRREQAKLCVRWPVIRPPGGRCTESTPHTLSGCGPVGRRRGAGYGWPTVGGR